MKLKDARKLAIKYCEEYDCSYTYIAHKDGDEFYVTNEEDKHTVFLINRNGSISAYRASVYSVNFHKELKRRKNQRRKIDKKKIADVINYDSLSDEEGK